AELAIQTVNGLARAVERQRCGAAVGDRAQIVDTVGVVGVVVREEHRVDPVDAGSDELQAELGWGIDEDARARIALDHGADAGAAVAGVRGPAYVAPAAQLWHAERGSRAEERQPHATSIWTAPVSIAAPCAA